MVRQPLSLTLTQPEFKHLVIAMDKENREGIFLLDYSHEPHTVEARSYIPARGYKKGTVFTVQGREAVLDKDISWQSKDNLNIDGISFLLR